MKVLINLIMVFILIIVALVSAQNPPLPTIPGPVATVPPATNPNYPTIQYQRQIFHFYPSLDVTGDSLKDMLVIDTSLAPLFSYPSIFHLYSSITGQSVALKQSPCISPPPGLCSIFTTIYNANLISSSPTPEFVTLNVDPQPIGSGTAQTSLSLYDFNIGSGINLIGRIYGADPIFSGTVHNSVSMSGMGDVNNDGREDFLLWPGVDSASGVTEFYVMDVVPDPNYPATTPYPYKFNVIYSALVPGNINSPASSLYYPLVTSPIDDITGDGIKDIFISKYTGLNYFIDGSNGATLLYTLSIPPYVGSQNNDITGISSVGDLSGDGYSEVAVTRYHYLLPAFPAKYDIEIHNVVSGNFLYTIPYPLPGAKFDHPRPAIRDVNGDGILEIIVGDHPQGSSVFSVPNKLHVFMLGQTSATLLKTITDTGLPLNTATLGFGERHSVGDQDGDGIDEIFLRQSSFSEINSIYKLFGSRPYGAVLSSGNPVPGEALAISSTPVPGNSLQQTITISGATPNTLGLLVVSYGAGDSTFGAGNNLWVNVNQMIPPFNPVAFTFDSSGQVSFTTNLNDPAIQAFLGNAKTVYLQAFNLPTGNPNLVYSSNGLQVSYV